MESVPTTPVPVPEPDGSLEPDGFVVVVDPGDRIHFLDWHGPTAGGDGRAVLAIHGLSQTAWQWAPVARRVGGEHGAARFVAMDLRGHGLSDAPTDDGAYDLATLTEDAVAVAEGAGLMDRRSSVVLAGHGFGAVVAAAAALALDGRCAGLVLVDGGWESLEAASGMDAEEFLRGLAEPPEVMRSMSAFLGDRAGFDPRSWDADQERAARATVVETRAGRLVPTTRPHVLEACVRTMFAYDPIRILSAVPAPITALMAADDPERSRGDALAAVSAAREAAGRGSIEVVRFGHDGHNLMRYRPREVAAALLRAASG